MSDGESPIKALIRASIEAQNPDKKDERELGHRLLLETFMDRYRTMKKDYREEREELRQDVADGFITEAEMHRQLKITMDLINAYAASLQKLLK